jgi:hypothetical protein
MTDNEKLIIFRLLQAIEDHRRSERFTLSLPPKHGELEAKQQNINEIRKARQDKLDKAMTDARELLK